MPSERRLHPLSILFGLGSLLRSFALPGLAVLVTAGSAGWGWQAWLLWLLPLYAIVGVGRYLTFRYHYEPHEMVVRTGFLFRNERHIPYARIQNLDGVQNVFHRLFNVVTVRVETGGGKEPEATMSVLPVADLEEMRRRVFAGKAAGSTEAGPEEASAEPAPGRTLLHLPPRELLLFGLIVNRSAVLVAAALGLYFEFQMSDRFFGEDFYKGPLRDAIRGLLGSVSIGDWLASSRIAVAVASVLALLVLLRLVSMAWALVRLHGFRLTLAGEDLRTQFGLLTRVTATIPLRRIQTLSIREGPFFRLCGRVSVKADTAGADGGAGEEKQKHREWLAPILRRAELPSLVQEVLPGLDLTAVEWKSVHPRAFRRELKKSLLAVGVIAVPLVIFLKVWALLPLALLVLWTVVVARQSVAHLGWAATGDAVLFRSGWLWRRVIVARFVKIQAVAIHESPFDRRAAMARVRVDTAGAKDLTHRVDIPYLARETARELHDLLSAQAARTAFRW
ncbi:MAG TPA: PH domain-containing protein [Thermoanaerobaculia bacterium]|nr:PH domain-containing protein [Thermoanaerobaculia bacterium]